MKITKINSKNYPIFIGNKIFGILKKKIKISCPKSQKIAIIYDNGVPLKYLNKLRKNINSYKIFTIKVKPTEKNKSLSITKNILDNLLSNNFYRSDLIISVGGGIVGDISGFTASIFKRGINFINMPTTLLAQVDSAIGGKTGVNSTFGKNLIGSFYNPKLVLIDTSFLISLPKKQMICGYAEILKHAIIKDKSFFYWLKINTKKILFDKNLEILKLAIKKSCLIKLSFVDRDFKESNIRMKLNFGHTFAHAIESYNKFSQRYNHGEAVLVGMIIASKISTYLKICSKDTLREITEIYNENNLSKYIYHFENSKNLIRIVNYMKNDKKNYDENINLVLLNKIGKTTIPGEYKFSTNKIKNILKNLLN